MMDLTGLAGLGPPELASGVAEYTRDTSGDTNSRQLGGLAMSTGGESLTPAAWSGALRSGPALS